MKTRSIGELPAFPMAAHPSDVIDEIGVRSEDGMTYRQWLIAHVASGLAANPSIGSARVVDMAFQITDEIVERFNCNENGCS